jgi:hypothetical protein
MSRVVFVILDALARVDGRVGANSVAITVKQRRRGTDDGRAELLRSPLHFAALEIA